MSKFDWTTASFFLSLVHAARVPLVVPYLFIYHRNYSFVPAPILYACLLLQHRREEKVGLCSRACPTLMRSFPVGANSRWKCHHDFVARALEFYILFFLFFPSRKLLTTARGKCWIIVSRKQCDGAKESIRLSPECERFLFLLWRCVFFLLYICIC